MRKFKIILLSTAICLLTACSFGSKSAPDPQATIKDMITQMQDVTSLSFNLAGDVNHKALDQDMTLAAKINLAGDSITDKQNPQADFTFDIDLKSNDSNQEDMAGKASLQIRVTNKDFYFQLKDLTLPTELQTQIGSFVDMYKGKWFKFPSELLPDELKNQIVPTDPATLAKQEQIKEITRNTQFFDVTESLEEGNNWVYNTTLNTTNTIAFLKEIAKIQEEEIREDDVTMIQEALDSITQSFVLKIEKDSHYLTSLTGNITMKDDSNDLTVVISSTMSNFNSVAPITAPEGAEDFNPMALMGLGLMMSGETDMDLDTLDNLNEEISDEVLFQDLETDSIDMEALEDLETISDIITE